MKFTFGILTGGDNDEMLKRIHQSIMQQGIDKNNFEILFIGGKELSLENSRFVQFDETIKSKWITRKKNILAKEAKYNNLCIMHDYMVLSKNWYSEFQKFGEDWDVCMNSIINLDGQRFRDWITWVDWSKEKQIIFLDYDETNRTEEMYVSGSFFCVKKHFFLENPLNEDLIWGEAEDVEWSGRIRHKWNYKINSKSKIHLLKQKLNTHWYLKENENIRKKWNA